MPEESQTSDRHLLPSPSSPWSPWFRWFCSSLIKFAISCSKWLTIMRMGKPRVSHGLHESWWRIKEKSQTMSGRHSSAAGNDDDYDDTKGKRGEGARGSKPWQNVNMSQSTQDRLRQKLKWGSSEVTSESSKAYKGDQEQRLPVGYLRLIQWGRASGQESEISGWCLRREDWASRRN